MRSARMRASTSSASDLARAEGASEGEGSSARASPFDPETEATTARREAGDEGANDAGRRRFRRPEEDDASGVGVARARLHAGKTREVAMVANGGRTRGGDPRERASVAVRRDERRGCGKGARRDRSHAKSAAQMSMSSARLFSRDVSLLRPVQSDRVPSGWWVGRGAHAVASFLRRHVRIDPLSMRGAPSRVLRARASPLDRRPRSRSRVFRRRRRRRQTHAVRRARLQQRRARAAHLILEGPRGYPRDREPGDPRGLKSDAYLALNPQGKMRFWSSPTVSRSPSPKSSPSTCATPTPT